MRTYRISTLIALAGTLIAPLSAARASVVFVGCAAARQADLLRVHDGLPCACRRSEPVRVQMLDDAAMDCYLRCRVGMHSTNFRTSAIDGLYEDSSTTITLRVGASAGDLPMTFAHEYGHYVWSRVLSADQRAEFARVYRARSSAHQLVSTYAAVSVEEGFAEDFAFHALRLADLRSRDPISCQLLDTWLAGDTSASGH